MSVTAEPLTFEAMSFPYNQSKSLEAVLYIANKLDNPGKHNISKLLYLADQYHLIEFGVPITGDNYIKMNFGPVPSNVYDGMKGSINWSNDISVGRVKVEPKRKPDLNELSESEIEALDYVVNEFGDNDFQTLTRLTHGPAWNSARINSPINIEAIYKEAGGKDKGFQYVKEMMAFMSL